MADAHNQPEIVLVTGTVQSIGASLYAYALASVLGPRPAILRATTDLCSPLLTAYLNRIKTGRLASTQSYATATELIARADASTLGQIAGRARDLGSTAILIDATGPGKYAIDALADAAPFLIAYGPLTVVCAVGITASAHTHARRVGELFPMTRYLVNPLLGDPNEGLPAHARLRMTRLSPDTVRAIAGAGEPLDTLAQRSTIHAFVRVDLGGLLGAVRDDLPRLRQATETLHA